MLLDGPVPPTVRAPGTGAGAGVADGVLDECLADEGCRRVSKIRAGSEGGLRVSDQERQVTLPSGVVTLQRQHVGEAIRYMLYSSREVNRVPLVLHAAYGGNFAPTRVPARWRGDGTFDALI